MNLASGVQADNPFPLVGELLVGAGFVSAATLRGGLARQELENRKLGELIVGLGMLEQIDLDAVLAIQDDLKAGNAEELAAVLGSRLGAILVASEWVSKEQLEHALTDLENSDQQIGEILVRQGAISQAQLNGALAFQREVQMRRSDRFKLGRMLVGSGDLTEQSLNEAMERQKVTGRKLGETLLESGAISKTALQKGLSRQRRLITAAIAAFSFVVGGGVPLRAAAATTQLQVSARILTHVSFKSMKAPTQVAITAADIALGYVDLEEPVEMEVRTNSAHGILVGISLNSPQFEGATVSGPGGTERITSGVPSLVFANHGQGMHTESLSFKVRIELARNTTPGVFAMPVSVLLSQA
jgi:hypothetical protein